MSARSLSSFDSVTTSFLTAPDRSDPNFRVLRQALGYAWSVVVAASPDDGVGYLEKWLNSDDQDVRWVMKENLKKKRLDRALPEWTAVWRGKLGIRT